MTPKEQTRMKILLLVLFGVAIIVIAFSVMNGINRDSSPDNVPVADINNVEIAKKQFDTDFQEYVAKNNDGSQRIIVESKNDIKVEPDDFQKKLNSVLDSADTDKSGENMLEQQEFIDEFNNYLSKN
jgi:hypothetical protein